MPQHWGWGTMATVKRRRPPWWPVSVFYLYPGMLTIARGFLSSEQMMVVCFYPGELLGLMLMAIHLTLLSVTESSQTCRDRHMIMELKTKINPPPNYYLCIIY